jgi:hypothetical protein
MSDEETQEELKIAAARQRDERGARMLGDFTPVEGMLDTADERALLWHEIIDFLWRVESSGPDYLATPARALLDRVHKL